MSVYDRLALEGRRRWQLARDIPLGVRCWDERGDSWVLGDGDRLQIPCWPHGLPQTYQAGLMPAGVLLSVEPPMEAL